MGCICVCLSNEAKQCMMHEETGKRKEEFEAARRAKRARGRARSARPRRGLSERSGIDIGARWAGSWMRCT